MVTFLHFIANFIIFHLTKLTGGGGRIEVYKKKGEKNEKINWNYYTCFLYYHYDGM